MFFLLAEIMGIDDHCRIPTLYPLHAEHQMLAVDTHKQLIYSSYKSCLKLNVF